MAAYEKQGGSVEYYTPKYVFDAMAVEFDVDVASPVDRSHTNVPAREFITEDSLSKEWRGFAWMNQPYNHQKEKLLWIDKFMRHNNGVALMPDRTSAPWWQLFAKRADAILFVAGKIKFVLPDGSTADQPGNGTTLFACGNRGIEALQNAQLNGLGILRLKP